MVMIIISGRRLLKLGSISMWKLDESESKSKVKVGQNWKFFKSGSRSKVEEDQKWKYQRAVSLPSPLKWE